MKPVDKVLDRLDRVRKAGKGWAARCPAHRDRNPSLSIAEGDNGAVLVKCFAGCEVADVVAAIGLEMGDLFPPEGSESSGRNARHRNYVRPIGTRAERETAEVLEDPAEVLRRAPATINAAQLLKREFEPVQWALHGILPEGVTILSGDPKIGKSWLLYQAGIAIGTGRPLWAGRPAETQGEVLMLALEDNERRLQRRLATLMPHFTTIKDRRFVHPDVSAVHLVTEWPRAEAGIAELTAWLAAHPACRLVVVDTVSAFRQKDLARNKSAYAADYEVGEMFKPLARAYSCAIVLVMHNRKQHSQDALQLVSGTQGMTGGVDNVLVLRRERGQLDAGLYVDGRDIEEPQEIALRFDNGFWSGTGQTVDEARMSKERRRVVDVIEALGGQARARAIADELFPMRYASVRSLLAKMVKAGELALASGSYSRPGTVGTTGTKAAA